jgi:hypothetical protein
LYRPLACLRHLHPARLAAVVLLLAAPRPPAQTPRLPAEPPTQWMQAAADREVHIIDDDGTFPVRYTARKIDSHTDTTRATVESLQGTVARMMERNGKPLTPEEDAAERDRLNAILAEPADWLRKQKRNTSARGYATDLVKLMPKAMVCTYAPGQPQPPGATSPQVVLDFTPDPGFKPPTTISQILTGLQGRLWIDRRTQVLTRVEGRVIKPVNFGWGILARVYPGGAIEFEQAEAGKGRWIYSHLDENITLREIMIKTVNEKIQMAATDIHLLPAAISYREAIAQLLALQLPR